MFYVLSFELALLQAAKTFKLCVPILCPVSMRSAVSVCRIPLWLLRVQR